MFCRKRRCCRCEGGSRGFLNCGISAGIEAEKLAPNVDPTWEDRLSETGQ